MGTLTGHAFSQEIPYSAYIPSRDELHVAKKRAVYLRAAVGDCRATFAPIWDPVQYIVFPMLEPHLILSGSINAYEYAGELYYDCINPVVVFQNVYFILGDRLVNSYMTGSAERLDCRPDALDPACWEWIFVRRNRCLVRRK